MIRNHDVDEGRFEFGFQTSIAVIFNYFVGYQLIYPLVGALVFGQTAGEIHPKGIMLATLLTFFSMIYLVRDVLKRSFLYFKNNFKFNIKLILKYVLYIQLANIVISLLIQFFVGDMNPGNQELIEAGFGQLPILYGFTAVIFAPIVEEIVFRGVFYQQLRNRKSYIFPILMSSLSFGIIHTLPIYMMNGNPKELIFVLVYAAMGFFMVRAYEESGNIWTSIGVHFIHNGLATILMILM